MSSIKALNKKAFLVQQQLEGNVRGYAFTDCCPSFAPGWEVGTVGDPDPCPWKSDLSLCWATCYWSGQVPDQMVVPNWLDSCGNINNDWQNLSNI